MLVTVRMLRRLLWWTLILRTANRWWTHGCGRSIGSILRLTDLHGVRVRRSSRGQNGYAFDLAVCLGVVVVAMRVIAVRIALKWTTTQRSSNRSHRASERYWCCGCFYADSFRLCVPTLALGVVAVRDLQHLTYPSGDGAVCSKIAVSF